MSQLCFVLWHEMSSAVFVEYEFRVPATWTETDMERAVDTRGIQGLKQVAKEKHGKESVTVVTYFAYTDVENQALRIVCVRGRVLGD